jgi:hypothetical protein
MVMFKARFHTPEPTPHESPGSDEGEHDQPQVPPIEKERGPQAPVKEPPGESSPPQRV